jgi:tetratricopeptide (TPR) repeat protein
LAGDVATAAKYYQRRIALDKADPMHWFEFGTFCLRTGDCIKGEECLEEVIALQGGQHAPALVYLGCRAFGANTEKALAFLEEAIMLEKDSTPGGGFTRVILSIAKDAEEGTGGAPSKISADVYDRIVTLLLDIRATTFAERVLSAAVTEHGNMPEFVLALARAHHINGRTRWAEDFAQRALDQAPTSPRTWALLSDVFSSLGNTEEAIAHMRKAVELQGDVITAEDTEALRRVLKLGRLCETSKLHEEAKEQYLRVCKAHPASCFWLGVGRACMNLGELDEAERCLAEANILNIEDPDVWGLLCLTCLKLGREAEADESIAHGLHLGLSNIDLLCEIASAYLEHGNPALAEKAMRAITTSASPTVADSSIRATRLLADSLMRQGKLEDPLPLYEKIASSKTADPADRDHATQKIAELLALAKGDPDLS